MRRARIAFTVDEEIGRGVDHFDLEAFGADFGYTLDGSVVGEIENETLSAIELKVTFHGVGVHPGTAKGKLVNPIKPAARVRRRACRRTRCRPRRPRGARVSCTRTRSRAARTAVTVTLILRDFDGDAARDTRRSCGGWPRRRSRTSRARA